MAVRKNLMVDKAKIRELAQRQGVSESEAVRRAVEAALVRDDLQRLVPFYEIDDEAAIASYVRRFPFVIPLLEEARPAIDAAFGAGTPAGLEVFIDPETTAPGGEQLFVVIRPDLPPDDAYVRLDRLVDTWFLDAAPRIGGRLNLTVGWADDAL
jgi:hypothetical protein